MDTSVSLAVLYQKRYNYFERWRLRLSEWTVDFLDEKVCEEYLALPRDVQAKIAWIVQLIEQMGLEEVGEPYIKHIQEKLWEIRGKSGRALYVTITGKVVIILRCFTKTTNKTPLREIEIALSRLKEMESNENTL
jgi:phage-related protein